MSVCSDIVSGKEEMKVGAQAKIDGKPPPSGFRPKSVWTEKDLAQIRKRKRKKASCFGREKKVSATEKLDRETN